MTTVAGTDAALPPGQAATPTAPAIEGRLFVVGCARSGTTLLQSFLAAHPAVLSFPETAVFGRLLSTSVMPGETRLGTTHRRTQLGYRHATALLDTLGRRDLEQVLPMRSKSIGEFVDGFVGMLDRLTLDEGKSCWVEKTPENLVYVPEILELVPGAKFFNILRDGRQNVASLYEMARQYPDRFWAKYRTLDAAIERWNGCVRRTRRLLNVPGVLLVRHERLILDTEAVAREICGFAGLAFSRDMIDRRTQVAQSMIRSDEPWKADVFKPIRSVAEDKFDRLFDAEQKAYIEARLERIDF